MDFAFGPGVDFVMRLVRGMFALRSDTHLVNHQTTKTLQDYVDYVNTNPTPADPVRHMYLAAHGNSTGYLAVDPFDNTNPDPTATYYEALEQAETSGLLELQNTVIGDPPRGRFKILGCNIGKAAPFVQKIKDALGYKLPVLAPRHFYFISGSDQRGYWEAMFYEFRLHRTTPFKNKQEAVDTFKAKGFTQIGGDPVPDEHWAKWIAGNPAQKRSRKTFYAKLSPDSGGKRSLELFWEWRYDPITFTFTVTGLPADPGNSNARKAALQAAFEASDPFVHSGFPVPERFGFQDVAEFIDGWNWSFRWNDKQKALTCTGLRHQYTCVIPITHPFGFGTGDDVLTAYNYTPPKGSALDAVDHLPEDDPAFFTLM